VYTSDIEKVQVVPEQDAVYEVNSLTGVIEPDDDEAV
jgi:hypothetical protein